MAAAAVPKALASGFTRISTTCACGAPTAVYLFGPFRAFCAEHAPSQVPAHRVS